MNLGARVGPLPAWGWGVAGGGALIVGVVVWRKRKSAGGTSAAMTTSSPATDPLSGYSTGGSSNLFSGDAATTSLLSQIEAQISGTQGANTDPASAIYAAYVKYLGHPPSPSDLGNWLAGLNGNGGFLVPGASGSDTLDQVLAWIPQTPEAAAWYIKQQQTGIPITAPSPTQTPVTTPPSGMPVGAPWMPPLAPRYYGGGQYMGLRRA